jgi:hypothetical protein
MKKFKRAFALNPTPRLEQESLHRITEEVLFLCPGPVYDAMSNDLSSFSKMVSGGLSSFDPENDVLVAFGDPIVLAMAASYLTEHDSFYLARYSKFNNGYVTFKIDNNWEINHD